ncbi:MAG: glycosyltransferase family 39 protein, partial [Deltaproteobacteria bacterium]
MRGHAGRGCRVVRSRLSADPFSTSLPAPRPKPWSGRRARHRITGREPRGAGGIGKERRPFGVRRPSAACHLRWPSRSSSLRPTSRPCARVSSGTTTRTSRPTRRCGRSTGSGASGSSRARVPQYYPLTFTSLWLDHHLWGVQPLGYHLVNVLLHGANVILVWVIGRRLALPGAWLAAAVFAVHPVHVESVAWVTERRDVLSGFFFLTAVLAYLRGVEAGDRPARRWLAGSMLLFAGGLLSKASIMALPAVLVLLDVYPLRRGAFAWRRLVVEKAGYWALGAAGAVGALVALKVAGLRITSYGAYGPGARV